MKMKGKHDSARYKGNRDLQGKLHGKGLSEDVHGNRYEGDWAHGKPHGIGARTFANGDYHSGSYVNGTRHGPGVYVFKNGNRFEGEFKDGEIYKGTFRWADQSAQVEYCGMFKDGLPSGKGSKLMRNGDYYTGEWLEGKAHGWGLKTFAVGDKHEGYYVDNERHGYGKYVWLNGDTIEGYFHKGRVFGTALRVFNAQNHTVDMVHFLGEFKDDNTPEFGLKAGLDKIHIGSFTDDFVPDGHGVILFDDGAKFVGELVGDETTGYKTFPSGSSFQGCTKKGKATGYGVKSFNNGDEYRGYFKKDHRHGEGIYTFTDGTKYTGTWKRGLLNGLTICALPGGHMLKANFKNGVKEGNAVFYFRTDGSIQKYVQTWQRGVQMNSHVLLPTNLSLFDPEAKSEKEFIDKFLSGDIDFPVGTLSKSMSIAAEFKGMFPAMNPVS